MKKYCLIMLMAAVAWHQIATSGLADREMYDPEILRIDINVLQPERELETGLYRIHEDVINRGFINYYRIESPFGTFEAAGDSALERRLNEIRAIDTLQKMSRSEVFVKTAGDMLSGQAKSVSRIVASPKETITGIPDGLNRLWERSKRQAADTYETVRQVAGQAGESPGGEGAGMNTEAAVTAVKEEGTKYLKKSLGVTGAHIKLARELQVDPYTDNQVLQEELSRMAGFIAASGLGLGQIMPSIPEAVSVAADVQKMVWHMDPLDLRLENEKILAEMGVDEETGKRFLDHKNYTTTQNTLIILALKELDPGIDRMPLIGKFLEAGNATEARFYSRWCQFIQLYARKNPPIEKVIFSGSLPVAITKRGRVLLILPVDYLTWTPVSEKGAERLRRDLESLKTGDVTGEIFVEGQVSPRAGEELAAMSWRIQERMFVNIMQ